MGYGSPRREFLHVDDLADACLYLMEHYDGETHINVGTGEDLAIAELAETVPVVYRSGRDQVRHVRSRTGLAAQAARRVAAALRGPGSRVSRWREGIAATYASWQRG